MKYLLDTHTFVWLESSPERLSPKATALMQDSENTLLLSLVTVWEMQIKVQIGKLKIQNPLPKVVQNQLQKNQIELFTNHTLSCT
jgi:PIN domain nuclease of toxin-antitoxin system